MMNYLNKILSYKYKEYSRDNNNNNNIEHIT